MCGSLCVGAGDKAVSSSALYLTCNQLCWKGNKEGRSWLCFCHFPYPLKMILPS